MLHLQATDPQLFVHLTWKTQDNRPILSDDQLRQAAFGAIMARTRAQLCRVLAIASTPCQMHLVASFPASLPINTLTRIAREAAQEAITRQQEAITRQQETVNSQRQESAALWQRDYVAHTLSAGEAAQAQVYLSQRIAAAGSVS